MPIQSCPEEYHRTEVFVWDCNGADETTDILLDPERPGVLFTVPTGVQGLSLVAEDDEKLDLVLLDVHDPSKIIVGNVQGVVNDFTPNGEYAGMSLECIVDEGTDSWSKRCEWTNPVTRPLAVRLGAVEGETQRTIARISVSYEGFEACPEVPPGCEDYDDARACQASATFGRWARTRYRGADGEAAWQGLADKDAFRTGEGGSTEREVPFWAWSDVCGAELKSEERALAFHHIDSDHNGFISKAEFLQVYEHDFADECPEPQSHESDGGGGHHMMPQTHGSSSSSSSVESEAGWSEELPSTTQMATVLTGVALVLWLILCVCFARACRKPKGTAATATAATHQGYQQVETGSRSQPDQSVALLERKSPAWKQQQVSPDQHQYQHQQRSMPGTDLLLGRLQAFPAVGMAIEEDPASARFHETRMLGYRDVLTDGFRAVFSEELLLVDARKEAGDAALRGYLSFLRHCLNLQKGAGSPDLIASTARAVAAALGGGLNHQHIFGDSVEQRWQQRLQETDLRFPRDLSIGLLLGGRSRPGALEGDHEPGAGLQRHRAILFKYVSDALNVCSSALLWDVRRDVVVSLAWGNGKPLLVDLWEDPGLLTENYELHHLVLQLEAEHPGVPSIRSGYASPQSSPSPAGPMGSAGGLGGYGP
eukprot:CAMPEP_0206465154 /NCGR_PEP_ID=MMETSP0324_2-20121206/27658_1 /ASSEMBLY_ACC=CAM_ASM_000836 /TAXON_ID=2866 /ORGANISM="Crypthecodinium cohnii, Strain Seligo" /LENGTH=652 /DNA_ID=CAMNT_0053937953 /DNA_START=49 /DNA_END=2007 /DNA_ORIENTATION=+